MIRLAFVSAFLILSVTASLRSGDAKEDLKGMEGEWTPATGEFGGKPFPDEMLKTIKLVLKEDTYTVTVGDKVDRGTVKLDASKYSENDGHHRNGRSQQGQDVLGNLRVVRRYVEGLLQPHRHRPAERVQDQGRDTAAFWLPTSGRRSKCPLRRKRFTFPPAPLLLPPDARRQSRLYL